MTTRFSHLDAGWFSSALGTIVAGVAIEPVAFTGATTDMARVRVDYGDGGSGPATLIAKITGTEEVQLAMDAAMGLFAREARFYGQFAGAVPVRTPECFHIGDGTTTPLLLEDLAGLRMGDQMVGLLVSDAERIIDALAQLHATYWNAPEIEADWFMHPGEGGFPGMVTHLVTSGTPALEERFADKAPPGVVDAVVAQAPNWGDLLVRGGQGPQTLVHHDCRLDNVFFADDGEPVFIDWQVLARTRGTQDVANLLAQSMDPEPLSANWEPLLRRYHAGLGDHGVSGYSWDECLTHYRGNVPYALGAGMALLGVMDIGDGRGLGDAITIRALSHIGELDALNA